MRVLIVDNNSAAADREKLNAAKPTNVEVHFLNSNLGYAAGINAGIRKALTAVHSHPAYCLVLNSDVIFPDSLTVTKLVNALRSTRSAVAASPLVHNDGCPVPPESALQVGRVPDYWTLLVSHSGILRRLPLLRRLADRRRYADKQPFPLNRSIPCDTINGACFLIEYDYLRSVGLFDEHTFLYMEEAIIGHRIQTAERFALLVTSTVVNHIQGVSTGASARSFRPAMYLHLVRSECYYVKTYLCASLAGLLLLRFVRVIDFAAHAMGVLARRVTPAARGTAQTIGAEDFR
jgi:GT2 family glycosyltransferase